MKKIISAILLMAILLSCCACGNQDAGSAEPALDPASPEAMYGHIDQTIKIDGVYKIWNAEGVQHMLNTPDGKFELLCNVDMEGAVVAPIAEFTGSIKGGNFKISNFTVQGGNEESFGFIGVNKGKIRNFLIENVTFIPGENAKNIGSLVGDNQGEVQRCTVTGTLNVEKAAADANCGALAGISSGDLMNTVVTVDLNYTVAGKANVGGVAGTITGGIVEFITTNGRLDVTDCTEKSVGLLAGDASNVVLTSCAFVGASNTQDGKLFTNFTGNPDDDERVVAQGALWRDNYREPLTEGQNKLRDRVIEEMNAMATVEWHLYDDLKHSCTCTLSVCHGVYNTTYTYYGIPYNHKGGSLERMEYILDEDGYVQDWLYDLEAYDGFDLYIGNDCSTALINAWWTVSNSVDFSRCSYQIPALMYKDNLKSGCIPVGTGWWEDITSLSGGNNWTDDYITINGEQTMMEAYAQMRKGDAYAYINEPGGHTRMVVEDPVVVRDQDGLINSSYSYVICTEQGSQTIDDVNMTYSTWKVNYKYTFGALLEVWAVPVTCEELLTGEMEPSECTLLDGADGYAGLYTGRVKANYQLDSVVLEVKDAEGNVVMNHKMFTKVDKRYDLGHPDGGLRNYVDEFDMANFAVPLSKVQLEKGKVYTYTITGNLHTYESYVVKEASFTYGQA